MKMATRMLHGLGKLYLGLLLLFLYLVLILPLSSS